MSMPYRSLSKEGHPTLGIMYATKPENARSAVPNTINVSFDDAEEDGHSLQYVIKPDNETGMYQMYFDGHKVPYPRAVFGYDPQKFLEQIYATHAHEADKILEDLKIGHDDQEAFAAARTLAVTQTPPPQHYDPPPSLFEAVERHTPIPITRERKTSKATAGSGSLSAPAPIPVTEVHDMAVLPPPATERKTPVLIDIVSMEEKLLEAQDQIRYHVESGLLPVMDLDDKSGYYTNIVDYTTGQIHQVGYSWKKRAPWHSVFQLREGIDPVNGSYEIPNPRITDGNLLFDGLENSTDMTMIFDKSYDKDIGLMKLLVRDILGKLHAQPQASHVINPPMVAVYEQPYVNDLPPMEPPAWLQEVRPQLERQEQTQQLQVDTKNTSGDRWLTADVLDDSSSKHLTEEEELLPSLPPSLRDRDYRRRSHSLDVPEQGLEVSALVDPDIFPEWIRETPIADSENKNIQVVQEVKKEEATESSLPKRKRVSRPLEEAASARMLIAPPPMSVPAVPVYTWRPQVQYTVVNATNPLQASTPNTFQSSIFGDPYATLGFI